MKRNIGIWILSLFLWPMLVCAQNYDKEQRWAEQVADFLLDGEALWLEAEGREFFSILTESESNPTKGALIVLHGSGVHPNWGQVILPIRVEMTTRGWTTLSIQMPVLDNDATMEQYNTVFPSVTPRIDAALGYLKSIGHDKVFIVAHSLGAKMASYYLARKSDTTLRGFIAIGMGSGVANNDRNTLVSLQSIKLPVLDLFGSDDLPDVLSTRSQRLKSANLAGNVNFQQLQVEGANHFFDDKNEELIGALNDWLAAF